MHIIPVLRCVNSSVPNLCFVQTALQAHNISSPPARTASFGGASGGGNERSGSGGVARRAADAITNLAHENLEIKNMVRGVGCSSCVMRVPGLAGHSMQQLLI